MATEMYRYIAGCPWVNRRLPGVVIEEVATPVSRLDSYPVLFSCS